ncbi:MAG: DUF4404 family protein [Pseudomonadota bacterium]|nr:DUF4404 family protein [Pseudomonadota bacterium]
MTQELKHQLEQLHSALQQTEALDDETHQLLLKVASDIDAIEATNPPSDELTDVLNAQVIQFEQDHPALSAILRQLTDTLGRMGV